MAMNLRSKAPVGSRRPDPQPLARRGTTIARASSATQAGNGLQKGLLTELATWMISNPVLFKPIKEMARKSIKDGAVKRGTDWDGTVQGYQARMSELQRIREQVENPALPVPDYYRVPFHAYDTGNLSWLAAFEAEPANTAIAMRTFKEDTKLAPEAAMDLMYKYITDVYDAYRKDHGLAAPKEILDLGCSVGVSTRWLARTYPQAQVQGADLSPYFLTVAEDRERRLEAGGLVRKRIQYKHVRAEETGLRDASVDFVALLFVVHELPADATRAIFKEAKRILRPGGVIMTVDTDPQSEVIKKLPPPIYVMMKSTEPHMDEFVALDQAEAMREAGFRLTERRPTDPRHVAVLGTA